jgi:hypothetical protein
MFLRLEKIMKKCLGLIVIVFSLVFIGCNENPLLTTDTTIFEKRTPVQKDTVKRRIPIEQVLPCLGLTRQQDSVIRLILREEKQCSIECKKEFQESIITLRQEYNAKMEQYRRVRKTDEIKKEIEILNFEFRQTQRDLEKEYKEKITVCVKNTHISIEVLLRKDQLTLWNFWKATGKVPCDRVKP